ncbi:MAG: VWA domain-containing protein [Clostridia bacterium]|nr:VWA domain-containing protein [Clostridia bacterium]
MEKKPIKISLKFGVILSIIIIILAAIVISTLVIKLNNKGQTILAKKDDWEYDEKQAYENSSGFFSGMAKSLTPNSITGSTSIDGAAASGSSSMDSAVASESTNSRTIGFSTGGAKDINNFRENIKNGYFPIATDITYNGLFYDYTFDTGAKKEAKELFSPAYSTAVSKDPISEKNELYMTVGLNSNIKQSDFKRKKLNLVVVLDISGSMSSSFNSYYYDQFTGTQKKEKTEDDNKSKMQIANESVNVLLDQLKDDDRIGMVLFDDSAYLGKPISLVSDTDINAIKNHVLEIGARGGTNFEAGYTKATELFEEYLNVNSYEYENRIIVITDAMPNYGRTDDEGLMKFVKENADKGVYTSFIGVGVDFNTELTEAISDVKGANYYSVHNSKEFKNRMGEEFEYMVTPLVFDLELNLKSEDYEIASVYGSDKANKYNGNIMRVNTLFPSKTTSNGEVKGGIIILRLNKKNEKTSGNLNLSVSYKDRDGKEFSNSEVVSFAEQEEHYDNTGIRKAIALTRYANAIKNWIMYERTGEQRFVIIPAIGIKDFNDSEDEIHVMLGRNERTSVKLSVSDTYKNVFNTIKQYITSENEQIKDENLKQEIEILEKLSK